MKGKIKFLRRTWNRFSKLGKGRKKKQKWRNPTGRHNKMRAKERDYPRTVSIGYRTDRNDRERFNRKKMILVYNMKDLESVGKDEIALLGKIGNKKKIEVLKKAKEMKIHIYGINAEKFIKKTASKLEHHQGDDVENKK